MSSTETVSSRRRWLAVAAAFGLATAFNCSFPPDVTDIPPDPGTSAVATATASDEPDGPKESATANDEPHDDGHVEVDAMPLTTLGLEDTFPGLSFREAVQLTHSLDGTGRLFVVQREGIIRVFGSDGSAKSTATFLDIRKRVLDSNMEEGLLGLAFAPDFAMTDHFFVYYSAPNPRRSVVSRFSVSASDGDVADPDSELVVLEVPQPFVNHNGGQITLGPDGYLYVGLGDGGSAGDPRGNGQDPGTLLGSILRLDVSELETRGGYGIPPDNPFADGAGTERPEVYAYGLRNPWRFSFDRLTGDIWAGDVGQNRYEEVDVVKAGLNYGWNVMEGFHCFSPGSGCDRTGLVDPVTEYDHSEGCSVTGGHVYRGDRLPSLYGAYVYGDFCSGKIWALRYDGSEVTEQALVAESGLAISAFGEDEAGDLYVLDFQSQGKIYRFVER